MDKVEVIDKKPKKRISSKDLRVPKKKEVKNLTLDQIEEEMIKLATDNSNDILTMMINEKKIAMLDKVATLKINRLRLNQLEQITTPVETKPLEVHFISSRTEEQKARLDRIDKEIIENRQIKQNA